MRHRNRALVAILLATAAFVIWFHQQHGPVLAQDQNPPYPIPQPVPPPPIPPVPAVLPSAQAASLDEVDAWEVASEGGFCHGLLNKFLRQRRFETAVYAFQSLPDCETLLKAYGSTSARVGRHEEFLDYLQAHHPECVAAYWSGVCEVLQEIQVLTQVQSLDGADAPQTATLVGHLSDATQPMSVRRAAFHQLVVAATNEAQINNLLTAVFTDCPGAENRNLRMCCVYALHRHCASKPWLRPVLAQYVIDQELYWPHFIAAAWAFKSEETVGWLQGISAALPEEHKWRADEQAERIQDVLDDPNHRFRYQLEEQ